MKYVRLGRYAKATARFLLLVGGLVSFGVSTAQFAVAGDPHVGTSLGLTLLTLAAMFFDPDNPPHAHS